MADESLVFWGGRSGRRYAYYVYPLGQTLSAAPGNFIYARLNDRGQWEALYVGEAADLAAITASEQMLALAREKGATHLHAHLTLGNRDGRFDEQADLRERFGPEAETGAEPLAARDGAPISEPLAATPA